MPDTSDMEKSVEFQDGWENTLQGVGISASDPNKSTTFNQGDLLSEPDIQALYTDEGIASRIVNLPVEDMLREGFTIESEDTEANTYIQKRYETLGCIKEFNRLFSWARACGGAIMVIGFDDGENDLTRPLNKAAIKDIKFIRVFDRFRVSNMTYNRDIHSIDYLKPIMYSISPIQGTMFPIHVSRCLAVDGVDCLDMVRSMNHGWGLSVFQNMFDALMRIGKVFAAISPIVDSFVQDVISIDGLHSLIVAGKEEVIKKRLQYIDMGKHVLNSVLLDKNETFNRIVSSVSGLADLIDRFAAYISSTNGIPQTILFGRSPAGMNSTGESDFMGWYDRVASKQETDLKPVQEKFFELLFLCKSTYPQGEPEDWNIKFNPLRQMTAQETAAYQKTIAETDKIYLDGQVATPDEVAFTRFGKGRYSDEPLKIVFNEAGTSTPEPKEPEEEEGIEGEEDKIV